LSAEYYEKGEQQFPQGSPTSVHWIKEAIAVDSTNSTAWWELSIPYLKRGMPHKWKPFIDKTVSLDPARWQGWRGYEKLFFYRDYRGALQDFSATDSLTPGFTDYPQGMSVDYLRGLAFIGLHDFESSRRYLDKYITEVTEERGEEWVDVDAFIHRGIVLDSLGDIEASMADFQRCLKYYDYSSDANYHIARLYLKQDSLVNASQYIAKAKNLFSRGYFLHRPYVETFCQLYMSDIDSLSDSIAKINSDNR